MASILSPPQGVNLIQVGYNPFHCKSNYNAPMATELCSWRDSCAFRSYANMCSDITTTYWIWVKWKVFVSHHNAEWYVE